MYIRPPTGHRYAFIGGIAVALLSAILAVPAFATDGTQLIGIGAQNKGIGGAGVASPKDMTWVLLNPASIVDLHCRIDLNFEVFAPDRSIEPRGLFANPAAGYSDDDSIFFIPALGICRTGLIPELSLGIGLYGTSGMGVDYKRSRTLLPFLGLANYDRRTEYSVGKLVVGAAHRFDNGWAIGLAPHLNYARFKSDMLTLRFSQTKGGDDWDDAWGIGFSAGVYKTWERSRFGATYTSRQWFQEFDDYNDLFFESMDIPQTFQIGVAYDFTPKVEGILDYKWINWSGIDQIADSPFSGGFGWEDQNIVKAGIEYDINDTWTVRGGVSYGNSPIGEDVVFANALFPAVTELHLSTGFTYRINDQNEFHFTYMHAFDNRLREDGRSDPFSLLGHDSEISLKENTFTFEYSFIIQRRSKEKAVDEAGSGYGE